MKRPVIIVAIAVAILAVSVALVFLYFRDAENRYLEPTNYKTLGDLQADVERLEILQSDGELSWQKSFRLGVAYLQSGQHDKAAEVLEEVVETRPGYYKAYESLGMVYYRLGEFEKAIETWQSAIDLSTEAEHLKEITERTRRNVEATKRITALEAELAAGRPVGVGTRYELGALYLMVQRPVEARAEFEVVTRERGETPDIFDAIARTYLMEGDLGKALEIEQKALSLDPDNEGILKLLDMIERAIETTEKLSAERPPSSDPTAPEEAGEQEGVDTP